MQKRQHGDAYSRQNTAPRLGRRGADAVSKLTHGDARTRLETPPDIGDRLDGGTATLRRIAACSFEVNFRTTCDVITLATAPITGKRRYDSDKHFDLYAMPFKAFVQPAGTSTFTEATATGEFFAVHVEPHIREELAEEINQPNLMSLDVQKNVSLVNSQSMVASLRHAFARGFAGGKLHTESLALLIYADVLTSVAQAGANAPRRTVLSDARLAQVIELIETTLDGRAGLSDLAASVGLSTYHFARAFKAATGLSPHAYVVERRLARARELLTKPDAILADVAYAVGFSSQAHMTDVFRKKLGVTPGQFRRDATE